MADATKQSLELKSEPVLNRRRLLKVAVATAPVIATLPTGAALARSSNLIGATSGPGKDALGRLQCLDLRSGTYSGGMLDLGVSPNGNLKAITDRDWHEQPNGGSPSISEREMCTRGGDFYYNSTGWKTATVPRGIVVSATALSSFAGSIYIKEV